MDVIANAYPEPEKNKRFIVTEVWKVLRRYDIKSTPEQLVEIYMFYNAYVFFATSWDFDFRIDLHCSLKLVWFWLFQ